MYHPRFKGNHYIMGQKMGNIFKKLDVRFPINLDSFQIDFGKKSSILLQQYFPEATAEIKGITDVAGYNNEIFTSWMMCMGCCLYNLSANNSAEIRGCTALSFMHKDSFYHARNNDLPIFLKEASKSVFYQPLNGNNFILNTSSFINGEEGINEYGLVAAMTFVLPKIEEIKPGFNSVFLVRYILEKCKNVQEGITSLEKLPIASSCNILLTDKSGSMVVVECNPLKMNIRYPEKNTKGEYFIITVNHFTSEEMWKHDASDRTLYSSDVRYETAYNALKDIDYRDGIEHAKNILKGKYGFMCQYDKKSDFDTIWSSVFDITNGKIYRAEDNPVKKKFSEDKRLSIK
jgi:predicted choloylglycine hydrolase